jgi:hypothetical protein
MASARPIGTLAVCSTLATVAAIAVAVTGAAVVAPTGCSSNCASDCPSASVYIGNLDNQQLNIDDIIVNGPACPPQYGVYCVGDLHTTTCTHVTITGTKPGTCDVLILFPDRPAQIVHTEFGAPIQKGCCKGYSIIGDDVFVIPTSADAGVSGVDGSSDQVTTYVEAGATDASDAGAD